ncbi:MAG TPA: Ig-like domain-containing protein, partial [Xanthomonadaceae bacterium]|nr:Ig-like domain-containing protein [Xanthomonadaceae bacterium]
MVSLFVAGAAWADSLALMSGAGQQGLAGSTASEPLVVSIRDANGAPIPGRTIDWSTSNGFVLSAASSVSDANGLASVTFTYGNYGTTAIVASDPVGATSTQAEETSIGMDSFTLVSGSGQAGKSGSASAQPIVVQLLDASGHPIVGSTIDWTDKTAYTHVNAATSVTDANGDASMGFTYVGGAVSQAGNTGTIQATNSTTPSETVLASETVVGFDSLALVSP